jgi:hypothetical protein
MANMHVQGRTSRGYRVVCHFAVPAGNNNVGLSWRTAYARSKGAPAVALTTVLPDGDGTLGTVSSAEKTSLTQAAPTLAEVMLEFQIPDDWGALSGAQQQTRLDEWYAVAASEWTAGNGALLGYWGFTR